MGEGMEENEKEEKKSSATMTYLLLGVGEGRADDSSTQVFVAADTGASLVGEPEPEKPV